MRFAFCLLPLCFVGVFAETITLVAQYSSSYSLAVSSVQGNFIYPFESNRFAYSSGTFVYLNSGSSTISVFDIRSCDGFSSSYAYSVNAMYFWDGILYCCGFYKGKICLFSLSILNDEFVSGSAEYFNINVGTTASSAKIALYVCEDGLFGWVACKTTSAPFWIVDNAFSHGGSNLSNSETDSYYSCFFANNKIVLTSGARYTLVYDIALKSYLRYELSGSSFHYDGNFYLINSQSLFVWDINSTSFSSVGNGTSGVTFYAGNGVLYSYGTPSSMSVPYTVYSGLPVTEPPPESSEETTTEEPSSDPPSEPGALNIYRTDIDRSGGAMVFESTLSTSIPLDGLESLSAYLGYYWDVDSSVQPLRHLCIYGRITMTEADNDMILISPAMVIL